MEPINPILNHHEEIDPHDIFPQVEDKLRAPIAGLPPCFVFRCHACRKARRDPSILDPADLFLPRTCADAGGTCDDPDCGEEPFTIQYLPGSFVLAEYGGPLWPAMVEYCPDESAAYCLRHPQPGVNLNDIAPYTYYIVFIGCDEHRLFGGWYSRQRLRPIPNGAAEAEINDPARRAALQQCNNYRHHSLRQRLLALSHSAANLRRQGLGMNGNRHTYN